MDIRVHAPTDEQFQQALDALRGLGVEVITGEADPIETTLWYVARMNSKLDNLGQLKHLHKALQELGDLTKVIEPIGHLCFDLLQERRFQQRVRLYFYRDLKEATGHDPKLQDVEYRERYEILRVFKDHMTNEDYNKWFDML